MESPKTKGTRKSAYLQALTNELLAPQHQPLDVYLRPLVAPASGKGSLLDQLLALPGLDGRSGGGRRSRLRTQRMTRKPSRATWT